LLSVVSDQREDVMSGIGVLELVPSVRLEVCGCFHASEEDVDVCSGCGWTADEHDFDLAA
jgi:hypothetical protein